MLMNIDELSTLERERIELENVIELHNESLDEINLKFELLQSQKPESADYNSTQHEQLKQQKELLIQIQL